MRAAHPEAAGRASSPLPGPAGRRAQLPSPAREKPPAGANYRYGGTGLAVFVLTLAAVAANVAWFARYGVGPLQLLRIAGPLWLVLTAGMVAFGAVAWLLARALGRGRPER